MSLIQTTYNEKEFVQLLHASPFLRDEKSADSNSVAEISTMARRSKFKAFH